MSKSTSKNSASNHTTGLNGPTVAREGFSLDSTADSLASALEHIFASAPDGYEPSEEFVEAVCQALYQVQKPGDALRINFEPERIEFHSNPTTIH